MRGLEIELIDSRLVITHPNQSAATIIFKDCTFHMPAYNNNFEAAVNGVTQAKNVNVVNNQKIGADAEELTHMLAHLRKDVKNLPDRQRLEAEALIAEIEEESNSDSPKLLRLKSYGTALWAFAAPVLSTLSKEYLREKLGIGGQQSP